jgi:hypothetical protein
MAVRSSLLTSALVAALMAGAVPLFAQAPGIREVTASDRSVIPLNTRLRYTTMIVLPSTSSAATATSGSSVPCRTWRT